MAKIKRSRRYGVRTGESSPLREPSLSRRPRSQILSHSLGLKLRELHGPLQKTSGLTVLNRPSRWRRRLPAVLGALDIARINYQQAQRIKLKEKLQRAINPQNYDRGTKTVCERRTERRQALFAKGVAGYGRRRSPGKNHSYQKTSDSHVKCERKK